MAMRRAIWSTVLGALIAVAALGMTITAASAQEAIQPNQHFIGLGNGSNVDPVGSTACPGPASPGRTGPVARGQTMSVAHVANWPRYAAALSQVHAWIDHDSSGP